MNYKTLLTTVVLGILALFFSVSTIRVFAQGPVNADPSHTLVFDNRPHSIPANISLWYAFYYAGDGSPIVMKMFDATNNGLDFAVYTPEQVRRLTSEDKPFGRGTAKNVSCGDSKCQDSDLTWKGATPIAGPYFVRVTNKSPKPQIFYLIVAGDGVRTGPPLQDDLAQFASPPETTNPTNTLPENAAFLKNKQPQTIPGNTGLWYRFDSNGDGSPIVITLADGMKGGVNFRIYALDQATRPDATAIVGEGTAVVVNCEGGKCPITDFSWQGALSSAGTYYILVYNATPEPLAFSFMIEGTSIIFAQ